MKRIKNEVHKALAVMDKDTGKILNYRQLMQHLDYKRQWSVSSATKFGWLTNGVGGRIKNPTNTIKFIHKRDVPQDRRKDVTYGQFVCTVQPEKAEKIEHDSQWAAIASIMQAKSRPQPPTW